MDSNIISGNIHIVSNVYILTEHCWSRGTTGVKMVRNGYVKQLGRLLH